MEELSDRLRTVASFVPSGARLLDVGSDHAYLPLYLMAKKQIAFAVAGEVVDGPYQSALSHVAASKYSDVIEVRLANGLAAMTEEDLIDTVVIAGMGGRLISRILAAGLKSLSSVKRLILQANNSEDEVRAWLVNHGFAIVAEAIIEEKGKFYEVIVAEQGEQELTAKELRFGPFLSREQTAVFHKRWQGEAEKLDVILQKIPDGKPAERQLLLDRIEAIKEVLDEGK
ncbi:tRNA (adenine(22)-N(1))-methyltransferase [Streptococcus rifensis]